MVSALIPGASGPGSSHERHYVSFSCDSPTENCFDSPLL